MSKIKKILFSLMITLFLMVIFVVNYSNAFNWTYQVNLSTLKDNTEIYCIQEGEKLLNKATYQLCSFYYDNSLDRVSKKARYIIGYAKAKNNGSKWSNKRGEKYGLRNGQEIIWAILNPVKNRVEKLKNGSYHYFREIDTSNWSWQGGISGQVDTSGNYNDSDTPEWVELYKEAYEYAETAEGAGIENTSDGTAEIVCTTDSGDLVVGPFCASWTEEGEKTQVTCSALPGKPEIKICDEEGNTRDEDGNPIQLSSDCDFYILINSSNISDYAKGGSFTLNYSAEFLTVEHIGEYLCIEDGEETDSEDETEGGTDDHQQALIAVPEPVYKPTTDSVTFTFPKLIPELKLQLDKQDQAGNTIDYAKFDVTATQIKWHNGGTLTTNGVLVLQPTELGSIAVSLKEKDLKGYNTLNEITIKFELNDSDWTWDPVYDEEWDENTIGLINAITDDTGETELTIINQAKIDSLNLLKIDTLGNTDVTAWFNIEFENIESINGNTDKYFENVEISRKFENLVVEDNSNPVYIRLRETKSDLGYKKIENENVIEITISNIANGNFDISVTENDNIEKVEASKSGNNATVTIENIPMMNIGGKVELYDFDEDYKKGATRSVLNGLNDIKVYLYDGNKLVEKDVYGDIIENPCTTTTRYFSEEDEIGEDGYYLFGSVEVKETYRIEYEYEGLKYIVPTVVNSDAQEFTTDDVNNPVNNPNNREIREEFNNHYNDISLGASEDRTLEYGIEYDEEFRTEYEEQYEKEYGEPYQGGYDDEDYLEEYDEQYEEEYGEEYHKYYTIDNLKTGNHKTGSYNTESIYARYFVKDISDWKDTWDANAWEEGEEVPNYNSTKKLLNISCILQKRIFDLSLGSDLDYATVSINGKTSTYNYDQILDGKIGKDLNRFYKGQTNSTELNDGKIEYNLNLYQSDYNYRIADYINSLPTYLRDGSSIERTERNEDNPEGNYTDIGELSIDVIYKIRVTNQSVLDFDTSSGEINVTGIKSYYDPSYTLKGIAIKKLKNTENDSIQDSEFKKVNEIDGVIDKDNIVTIKGEELSKINLGGTDSTDDLTSAVIYLKFEVNKNSDGYKALGNEDIDSEDIDREINANVITEITSYYTDRGFIDIDSEPGNLLEISENEERIYNYEDDTDETEVLTIKIDDTKSREISGIVFDKKDDKGNGTEYITYNDNDKRVNNVIVQLIELKELPDGQTYEYIWQQTRTGSGEVQVMKKNGRGLDPCPVNLTEENEDGTIKEYSYRFYGDEIIPGNYIVRFIYGDGRKQDVSINETTGKPVVDYGYLGEADLRTVQTYNGQDYKSVNYGSYDLADYNKDTNSCNQPISVARDNEARRLEVMAYSTKIDGELGEALNSLNGTNIEDLTDKEKELLFKYYITIPEYDDSKTEVDNDVLKTVQNYVLENTWMCAETLKLNIPVDASNVQLTDNDFDAYDVDENFDGENKDYYKPKEPTVINNFNEINFGIRLREQTKLELEKHITALSVKTESGKILLDAKAYINEFLDDRIINDKQGVTKGLSTIVSERQNRGFWKLETDLSELAQGAELNATYTYVIKNSGDTDYLSNRLVKSYTDKDIDNYINDLQESSKLVKAAKKGGYYEIDDEETSEKYVPGFYLGEYYYTGTVDNTTDRIVPTQVTKLQEALNNKFAFAEDDNEYFKNSNSADKDKNVFRDKPPITRIKENIKTVINNSIAFAFLEPKEVETSKTVNLTATITTDGGSYDSYIAEIIEYTNAAGRVDMETTPDNLTYVHSDDNNRNLDDVGQDTLAAFPDEKTNERDEFWGESIVISKPTGEDKVTPINYIVISAIGLAILGVGIVLIKKFAIKK